MRTAAVDIGTGARTVLAQIAADALRVDVDHVTVEAGGGAVRLPWPLPAKCHRWHCVDMVDSHSRGYESAARRMFWSGIALFLIGCAVLAAARTGWATEWHCDRVCRPTVSTTWRAVKALGLAAAFVGPLLTAAAYLMVTLRRRPPSPPAPGSTDGCSAEPGPE